MYVFLYCVLLVLFILNSCLIYAQQYPPHTLKDSISSGSTSVNQINISTNTNSPTSNSNNNKDKMQNINTNVEVPGLSEGLLGNSHSSPKNDSGTKSVIAETNKPLTTDVVVMDNRGIDGPRDRNSTGSIIKEEPVAKSSVVPRKGAPDTEPLSPPSNTHVITSEEKSESEKITINTNKSIENKSIQTNNFIQNSTESNLSLAKKKPESASDFTEDDGFSTGKDYVMTGIAIFVCIWAVIFGALFFYKRAGELWDRRHYRRMDFLVEGMYND